MEELDSSSTEDQEFEDRLQIILNNTSTRPISQDLPNFELTHTYDPSQPTSKSVMARFLLKNWDLSSHILSGPFTDWEVLLFFSNRIIIYIYIYIYIYNCVL